MSSYNELIKNFEKIRSYMREFYVYGFKSRDKYKKKSARSYDDERRRIESWLGDYMGYVRTPEGKNVFLSVDSRACAHNPFFKALKAKSFTDKDITLHFILLDLLFSPDVSLPLTEILERIDGYLAKFQKPMFFDESTVRKKLQEYITLGLITAEKFGKKLLYRRANDPSVSLSTDVLNFFSETAPCGVIGSFLLDQQEKTSTDRFSFKHHYITSAIDSDILATLFDAMHKKRFVSFLNLSRHNSELRKNRVVPLRIFSSAQNGRQHLMAYCPQLNAIKSFRVDYLLDVKLEEPAPDFDALRATLSEMKKKMWGVTAGKYGGKCGGKGGRTEHVEFTVKVQKNEQYIVNRLEREKRVGTMEKLDENTYRFSADVYDSGEITPWVRTFICRITSVRFSNKAVQKRFENDLERMYRLYGIEEAEK